MNFLNGLTTSSKNEHIGLDGLEPPPGDCRACGKNNLKAYVTASENGVHTPASECEYIYFKCDDAAP